VARRTLAIWWAQWLSLEPEAAVAHLETRLPSLPTPDRTIELVCDRLWAVYDERKQSGLQALRASTSALARLIPIVRAHVRPEDDLHRKGGYSPVPRDHAQQLRDSLVTWLTSIESQGALQALEQLAARADVTGEARDWLRHLTVTKATQAISKPMPLEDAIRLVQSLILDPQTEADLFLIARNRLRDIQHHVQYGEFSARDVYNPQEHRIEEKPVQIYLAGELEARSRKQYSVVRESEAARNKETDIRLWNARFTGPVTIEVKIAERWTVRQLEEAIRDQLVGKYMGAYNSNYGILALCSSGKAKTWEHAQRVLDFWDLLAHLTAYAQETLRHTRTIQGLDVAPIDFH
jgi:hypothetical protein